MGGIGNDNFFGCFVVMGMYSLNENEKLGEYRNPLRQHEVTYAFPALVLADIQVESLSIRHQIQRCNE
jgi:hypothetical protein